MAWADALWGVDESGDKPLLCSRIGGDGACSTPGQAWTACARAGVAASSEGTCDVCLWDLAEA